MNQHYLQLYADFIVKVGVNVQPRQNFIIRCPVTMPEFGHACVKAGYEAGAKNCIVRWEDDKLSRLHYEYAKEEVKNFINDIKILNSKNSYYSGKIYGNP